MIIGGTWAHIGIGNNTTAACVTFSLAGGVKKERTKNGESVPVEFWQACLTDDATPTDRTN
jgi:NaMN:DMB phosphoribosyltransferase